MKYNFLTFVNDRSYGLVGLQLLRSSVKLGHEVSLWGMPTDRDIQALPEHHQVIREALERRVYFDYTAPSILLGHQFDLSRHVGKGRRIGATIFELDRLKPNEVHQLKAQDLVIVPSKWAAGVVRESCGSIDVRVVPLGYDPAIFYPGEAPRKDKFRILHVGKAEYRKGHDFIVEVFNKAFTNKDKVDLVMSINNPFCTQLQMDEWVKLYLNSPLGEKITFLPWTNTQQELANHMRSVDIGLFPARAEGFNLDMIEMIACGKPVIATNYSGHTEFITEENSYRIEPTEMEWAGDGIWFSGSDGKWMSLGKDQEGVCVDYLRHLYRKKMDGFTHNQQTISSSVSDFTWDNSAAKLINAIS